MLALCGRGYNARGRRGMRALLSKASHGADVFWDWSGRRALRDLATQLRARAALTQDAVASYRVVAETISHFNKHYVAGKGWNIPELTAGLAVLAALDPEPRLAPDTSTCADVTRGSLVLQLRYFAQHAHAVYRTSVAHAAYEACMEPGAILAHRLTAAPLRPAHYLAIDHENCCIILSIRGTNEMVDFLTGASYATEPFLGGHAHRGAVEAARFLAERYGPEMASLQRQHPGYAVRVTGHSLGAAVGVLAVALLRAPGAPAWESPPEAVLFSTPPCATEPLARHCDAFAINTVFGDDVVGRLSLAALWDLQQRMQQRQWRHLLARAAERDSGVPDTVVRSLRSLVDTVDSLAARAQHEARELAELHRPEAAAAATAAAAREARRSLTGWVQEALRDHATQRFARSPSTGLDAPQPALRDWQWPWLGSSVPDDGTDSGQWPAGAEKAARRAVAAAEEAMTAVEATARAQWDQRPTRALEQSLSNHEGDLEQWVARAKQWYRPGRTLERAVPGSREEEGEGEGKEERAASGSTAEDTGSSLGATGVAWRRWMTAPATPTGPRGSLVGRLTGFARPWWRDATPAQDHSSPLDRVQGMSGDENGEGGGGAARCSPRRRWLPDLRAAASSRAGAPRRRAFPPGTFPTARQRRGGGKLLGQAVERLGAGPSPGAVAAGADRELLDLAISGEQADTARRSSLHPPSSPVQAPTGWYSRVSHFPCSTVSGGRPRYAPGATARRETRCWSLPRAA